MPKTYDPKTGTWKSSSDSEAKKKKELAKKKKSNKSSANKSGNTGSSKKSKPSGSNLKSTKKKSTAKGKSEKKANKVEYNLLKGSLSYVPTPETIKIRAGDTIKIKGIGSQLSGRFYVQDVTRVMNAGSGYYNTATIIKLDWGNDSVKVTPTTKKKSSSGSSKVSSKKSSTKKKPKGKKAKTLKVQKRIYTVRKGDFLWTIAKIMYNDPKKYTKIAKANHIQPKDYNKLKVGRKLIIP